MLASSLGVAAIPESLPIAITICLAISMNRMAKRNVIVKNLAAVEALGSCTVIASDKTGTLTMNELNVIEIITTNGLVSIASKITDILPLKDEISFEQLSLEKKILMAFVLPNEASEKDGELYGDPVDIAFLKVVIKKGYRINDIHSYYKNLELIPYTSEARFSASFNSIDNQCYAFAKGAPETIIDMCSISDADLNHLKSKLDYLYKRGLRVLAVACGAIKCKDKDLPDDDNQLKKLLSGLNFLALVAMLDPLRKESKQAVKECQDAGIKVVMVTGDSPKTAFAIASDLDFVEEQSEVVTGDDIKNAAKNGEQSVSELITSAKVFARVEPAQKFDIVESFKNAGNFVAVTGDGINDAPALKNANVGIAMGNKGTDIARESANIILTDDNFASIVEGVKEGRIAYSNIRKLIFFLTSTAFAEIGVFVLTIAFGLPMPFIALQLLWVNIITESIQGVALAMEDEEGNEMKHPPRSPDEPIFNGTMLSRIISTAIVMTIGCYLGYKHILDVTGNVEIARSAEMFLIILFENIQVFNSRSETISIFRQNPFGNKFLFISIITVTLLHTIASYSSFFDEFLKMEPLGWAEFKVILPIAFSIIVIAELEKLVRYLAQKKWTR